MRKVAQQRISTRFLDRGSHVTYLCHMTSTEQGTGIIPVWTLADRLLKARVFARLEQNELAAKLGISRASVSNYERGNTEPNRPVLYMYSVVTGVDLAWLIGDPVAEAASNAGSKGLPRPDSNWEPAALVPELPPWQPNGGGPIEQPVIDSLVDVQEFRRLLAGQECVTA